MSHGDFWLWVDCIYRYIQCDYYLDLMRSVSIYHVIGPRAGNYATTTTQREVLKNYRIDLRAVE